MEVLPIMINRTGVLIASEVIRGMPELSCNPVSSHLRRRSSSLIHCSLLLVIFRANEEAVIDPCAQGRLCSVLLSAWPGLSRYRMVFIPKRRQPSHEVL